MTSRIVSGLPYPGIVMETNPSSRMLTGPTSLAQQTTVAGSGSGRMPSPITAAGIGSAQFVGNVPGSGAASMPSPITAAGRGNPLFPGAQSIWGPRLRFGVPTPTTQPTTIVGTSMRVPNTRIGGTAGQRRSQSRLPFWLGGDSTFMQFAFDNWRITSTSPFEPDNTNPVTIYAAALESGDGATFIPLTFNSGAPSITLDPGAVAVLSDPILPEAFRLSKFDLNSSWWLRVGADVTSDEDFFPVGAVCTWTGATMQVYNASTGTDSIYALGAMPNQPGATLGQEAFTASAVLGQFIEGGRPAAIGLGDSIMDGTGDPVNPLPVMNGHGYYARACAKTDSLDAIASINVSVPGDGAGAFLQANAKRRQYFKYANVVAEGYGTNDITKTASAAAIYAQLQQIWAIIRLESPGVRIARIILQPQTSSPNSWETVVDQTPVANWGVAGDARDQLNADSQTAFAQGLVDSIYSLAAVTNAPSDPTKWDANGSPNYATAGDGRHPSAVKHAAAAPLCRAALEP